MIEQIFGTVSLASTNKQWLLWPFKFYILCLKLVWATLNQSWKYKKTLCYDHLLNTVTSLSWLFGLKLMLCQSFFNFMNHINMTDPLNIITISFHFFHFKNSHFVRVARNPGGVTMNSNWINSLQEEMKSSKWPSPCLKREKNNCIKIQFLE